MSAHLAGLFHPKRPLFLKDLSIPAKARVSILAPPPDDFDAIGVTLRFFKDQGNRIDLAVLTSGASGVENSLLACYASIIQYSSSYPMPGGTQALDPSFRSGRPIVWPLALLEWGVFFSTILWFASIGWAGRRMQKTGDPHGLSGDQII